jgi:sugar phosphate isomerase/epimerase
MVSELGYTQVEGWGGLYASPEAVETLKAHLGKNGLAMPTGHVGFDQMRDDPKTVLDFARALGMAAVIAPIAPGRDMDLAGWQAFTSELNEAAKPYRDAGLIAGYHNHHFEFMDKGGDALPIEIVMEGAPEVMLEMDVAWVHRGGHDPLKWMARYGERMIAAHLKDIAPEGEKADEDGWADLGTGVLDWKGLMAGLRKTGARYFVMEHDNPSDDRRFATASIAAAKAL